MTLGKQIAEARKAKGINQAELAEMIGVSPEAVSNWESGTNTPGVNNLRRLEELLNLDTFDEEGNPRSRRLFSEDQLSAFLKGKLNACCLRESLYALSYAKEKHAGTFRDPQEAGIPYINHPMTMACHALALGLTEDELIAALLLHDVAEDCGVSADELPFSPGVKRIVGLVTKPKKPFREEVYYKAIAEDPKASLVKCIDRCNNLSGMSMGFSAQKIAEYVNETERFYPELLRVVENCAEYNNAAWLLRYQMQGLLDMAKRIR